MTEHTLDKCSFKVVIPARFESTRLPGKPLRQIAGKPMILHTVMHAKSSGASEVLVATDDKRIFDVVAANGFDVTMTRKDHLTGTDRIAEVALQRNWNDDDIVVNLQGDEPLMPSSLLQQVAWDLAKHIPAVMATLVVSIQEANDIFDANIVKAVMDHAGYALYFSRAPIPWNRQTFSTKRADLPTTGYFRHVGLYAYRVGFLKQYVKWEPAVIEQIECLEQLRILANGHRIHLSEVNEFPGYGVDTEEDLARVETIIRDNTAI